VDAEKLKEFLAKIPLIPVLLAWAAYLGFQYYDYISSDSSAYVMKLQEIQTIEANNATLEQQIKKVQEFARNLEVKKMDFRNLSQELDGLKASVSENLDLPDFMKSTLTEARKVGLKVISLKPAENKKEEFYVEQAFDLTFRGAYVQLISFLERLANMQKLVRVDDFEMEPIGSATAKYVELKGVIKIKAYRYLGSKADELSKTQNNKAASSSTPATTEGSR